MAKPTKAKSRPAGQAPASKAGAKRQPAPKGAAPKGGAKRRPAPPPPAQKRPAWLIPAAAAGVVLALLVVAVLVTRGGGGDGDLAQTRPVTVTGTALPEMPQSGPDPAVGMPAPRVTGASFDGGPVVFGGAGRPTMVFFVAHWCPHCQREVPLLAPELGRITPAGVDVVTVATSTRDNAPNHPPSKWLRDEGWPTPVLADDEAGTAAKAYGLSGFPFYVLVGADGKVVGRGSGERTVAEVEALLKQLAPAAAG